ncbi:hypothetical protein P7C70_g5937, partial [Phenoliferia sp. Uapishka_3]
MSEKHPSDAPPSYNDAVPAPVQSLKPPKDDGHKTDGSTDGESDDGAIPTEDRYSMLEESRELPKGWVRQYDEESSHAFYIDEDANPPRSIWTHPYDDIDYLKSLPESSEVRQHYEHQMNATQRIEDSCPALTENKSDSQQGKSSSTRVVDNENKSERTIGRKIKDKLTGKSHAERQQERRAQHEAELKQYQQFIMRRKQAMEDQAKNPDKYSRPMGGYPGSARGYRSGYGYGAGYGGLGYGGLGGIGLLGGGLYGGGLGNFP